MKRKKNEPTTPAGLTKLHTLHVTDGEALGLKTIIEQKLSELTTELEKIEAPYREAEKKYLEYKAQFDQASELAENYKTTLVNLSNLNRSLPISTQSRTLRVTSHTEAKESKKSGYGWAAKAHEYLQRKRMFLSERELYNALIAVYKPATMLGAHFSDVLTPIKRMAEKVNNRKQNRKNSYPFIEYEGKIGLLEFCTPDLRPKPEYLRVFIQDSRIA